MDKRPAAMSMNGRRVVRLAIGLFTLQAVGLMATGTKIRLSLEPRQAHIYEGDMVSDTPPSNADEASRTVEDTWSACRYWTGLGVQEYLLPPGNCPAITPWTTS